MPTWWGRKSSKSKDDDNQLVQSHSFSTSRGIIGENKRFVDVVTPSRVTPRSSPDFSRASSRFDSDSAVKITQPLPRPSASTIHNHHVTGLASGSASISSVSSSGSADEQIQLAGVKLESPTGRNDDGRSSGSSKWKKGKFLGNCSFGQLFQGFDSEKGIMCAIKEVKVISDDETSKECVKKLNQEIHVLRELCHPNIVQYYGSELCCNRCVEFGMYYSRNGNIKTSLEPI